MVATRPIQCGCELLVCYANPALDPIERHEYLHGNHGFICNCIRCANNQAFRSGVWKTATANRNHAGANYQYQVGSAQNGHGKMDGGAGLGSQTTRGLLAASRAASAAAAAGGDDDDDAAVSVASSGDSDMADFVDFLSDL